MTIERTSYGLSNEHLFHDVDFVIYCEGSLDDGDTHDEMFWEKILRASGVSCVCKSRGSKNDILPLARRAIADQATNVAFAMDRDYGDFYGLPIEAKNVLYTYGYSWENDVLVDLDAGVIFSMFAPTKSAKGISEEFNAFRAAASEICNAATKLDVTYASAPVSLFDRKKPLSIFCGEGDELRLDVEKMRASAGAIQGFEPTISGEALARVQWDRHFFGKATSKLVYQWMVQKSQAIQGRSKIPYDAFLRMCISTMTFQPRERDRDAYYDGIARALS